MRIVDLRIHLDAAYRKQTAKRNSLLTRLREKDRERKKGLDLKSIKSSRENIFLVLHFISLESEI